MPSLRQISTSRSAHEEKAPIAQIVMTCLPSAAQGQVHISNQAAQC
jgi:hypothetical protein